MTQDDRGDHRRPSLTIELLSALVRCGLTHDDRRHLRFFFEASSLRVAVELAGELRERSPAAVHVRPAPLRRLARRRWTVTLTTPPAPLSLGAIHLWEQEMREVARRRPASRLVSWKLMLTPEDFERIGVRSP